MLYLNVETAIQNENEQYFAHSKQLKWIWFNSIAISPPKQVIVWFLKAFFLQKIFAPWGKPPKNKSDLSQISNAPRPLVRRSSPKWKGGGKSFPQNHPHLTSPRHGWKEDSLFSNLWITIAMCFYWERLCAKWVPWFCWRLIYPPKKGGGVPSWRFRPYRHYLLQVSVFYDFLRTMDHEDFGFSSFTKNSVFLFQKEYGHFSGSTLFGFTRALYSSPPFLWQISTWKWAQIMKHRRICCWGEIDLEQRQHWTVSCQGDGRF